MPRDHVCQLLIVLPRTDPLVWRRIHVPEAYSFWDLHVAIHDAMGWKDSHLHEFVLIDAKSRRVKRIGIPDDDFPDERPCLPGWSVPIERYLMHGADPVRYRYDFGDDWEHTVEFEALLPADDGPYPRCVAGAGACPPEDVGGTSGFAEFLQVIGDRRHPERAAMLRWAGGAFDPHAFDPGAVRFDDPHARWQAAFQESDTAV
ncbi:MAG: plasmid pRiA4b ORF-3 family protein [Thermodesulfobacteriota bacterium]